MGRSENLRLWRTKWREEYSQVSNCVLPKISFVTRALHFLQTYNTSVGLDCSRTGNKYTKKESRRRELGLRELGKCESSCAVLVGFDGPTPFSASGANKPHQRSKEPHCQKALFFPPVLATRRLLLVLPVLPHLPVPFSFPDRTIMSDWASDEFMSNWDKTYVSTNLKDGSKAYDAALFKELHSELAGNEDLRGLSSEILVSLDGRAILEFGC
jgi:hypothetical protein